MEIVLDEILVGERGRAHDVLASTLPDDLARSLAHYLDLPGQLPPGFDLNSYVSGFPHGDRYVFARTSIDPVAARQGMVFSHALVADVDIVQGLSDVTAVFSLLKATRPLTPTASNITLNVSGIQPRTQPSPHLCDLLSTSSDGPAIIVGPSILEDVIVGLWPKLLPAMRSALRFRLSFGPEEADISNVHIVAVPSITATRWPESRLANLICSPELARTATGRFLTDALEGDLRAFLSALSIECTSFQTLELSCRALEMSNVEGDFSKTLVSLRLIGSLQPDPNKAKSIKTSLLNCLAAQPGPISASDFLALRNFNLAPFSQKAAFLKKLTERFGHFFESDPGIDALVPISHSAFDPAQSTDDWQRAYRGALSELSTTGARSVAPLLWMTLSKHPQLGQLLLEQVAGASSMDEAMMASVDNVEILASKKLSNDLITAKFILTEATLLIRRYDGDVTKALMEACKRDRKRFGDHAVKHVLEQIEPSELLSATLAVNDPLVTAAAAAAVVSEPRILGVHSLRQPRIQAIWIEALTLDKVAWEIQLDTESFRNDVFDLLLDGVLTPTLVTILASSPLGNALDYPRRAAIWCALPDSCRDTFLSNTASAWIRSLPKNVSDTAYIVPEPELALALASPMMREHMAKVLQQLPFKKNARCLYGKFLPTRIVLCSTFRNIVSTTRIFTD